MAWMSEEAAATVLGVSFKTLRKRVGNGSIRAMRQGRQIFVDVEVARIATPNKLPAAPVSPNVAPSTPAIAAVNHDASAPPRLKTPVPHPISIPPQPSPMQMSLRPVESGEQNAGWWTGLVIWLLLTLFLTTTAIAAWFYQKGRLDLQEAESRYQHAVLDAQQAEAQYNKQTAALTSEANERENKLADELSIVRTQLDSTRRILDEQRDANSLLKATLSETTADLAETRIDRMALTSKLISAQATAHVLRWQASIGDSVRQLADRIAQAKQPSRTRAGQLQAIPLQAVDINSVDWSQSASAAETAAQTGRANDPDNTGMHQRALPHQPPTLGQEEARAALRAIVQTNENGENDVVSGEAEVAPAAN